MKNDSLSGAEVLVTGGMGFIGSNLVHRCVEEGATVRVLDCRLPGSGANPTNLEGIDDRIAILEGDVRDSILLSQAVDGVDLIIHCAAMSSHARSMENPRATLDLNCGGTLNLLETIKQLRTRPKLVYVGTTTQLGPMINHPFTELHPEFPRDIYSATMVGSEKIVLVYARSHGLPASTVRLCNIYGPRAAIHTAHLGFVNYFIGLGLQKRSLTIFGDGKQMRSLLYVDDAVEALRLVALNDETDGEVYLVGSDTAVTVTEITEAIAEHVGGDIQYVPWPDDRASIEVGDALVDSSKIRDALGWKPKVDLATGLRLTVDHYSSNLAAYL